MDKHKTFKKLTLKSEQWHLNSDQQNTEINVEWLERHVLSFDDIKLNAATWIFSHVPKTAGTSLESYLVQAFELKDVLHMNAPDLNELPQAVHMKKNQAQLITGHHPMHGMLYQLLTCQSVVHLSMMRDPIPRVVSFYNYISTRHYHARHLLIKDMSFDEFLKQSDMVEIHNGQAKRYAGVLHSTENISDKDLYFKAKYAIDHCFSLVGVTEFFAQFHKLIAKKCGVIFHELPPINRSKTKVQLASLSTEQMKMIKQKNKIDIQLYQYVRSKFLGLLNP